MNYIGIRGRIIFMVVSALILSILVAAVLFRNLIHSNVIAQKKLTTEILTASLVNDIKYDIERRSLTSIAGLMISKYMTYYRDIESIQIFDKDNRLVASSDKTKPQTLAKDPSISHSTTFATPSISWDDSNVLAGISSVYPILQGSKVIGAVKLDISTNDLEELLFEVNLDIFIILIIAVSIAVCSLFILLRGAILKRLTNLLKLTQEISAGNYKIQVHDKGSDEIGALAQSFNKMTVELSAAKNKIEDYNKHLEEKVKESTSKLHKAYDDLKNAQAQIVLNEKMASIGVLISGIAHEINTPIGTINNVSRELKSKVHKLPFVIQHCSDSPVIKSEEIFSCLNEILNKSQVMQTLPSYDAIRGIEAYLTEQNVEEWHNVSRVLTQLGIVDTDFIAKYLHILTDNNALALIEAIGNIANAVTISETSTKKIQNIIKALKYYAYTDNDKVEKIQINESLQTALILLENALKHEADIVIDFANDLPLVYCTCEIHQIWTNLLSNAFNAIKQKKDGEKGKITVTTKEIEGDRIYVSITDNGAGISKENLNKIFEPFFTTQDIGEGTGLGLTIVAGIVKKHHGSISVHSEPNKTTFEVILPVHGFQENAQSEEKYA